MHYYKSYNQWSNIFFPNLKQKQYISKLKNNPKAYAIYNAEDEINKLNNKYNNLYKECEDI